ncbi:MFS transporter [Streptomyces sp. 2333.5]|uniref:MFS transporter n=1 Tax=unclassified Streptomyces TaxID=2593676 RepID=UPI00089839BA|nr:MULTISPECIES: MFS transporter [unclassified Streptomyces]PJJ06359.1 MFS transporter [Streptomyces sp. 2333.5]SEE94278.1 Major Facilitator Superfamily protein [Streptomyces sp. 2314.4]SEF09161.1 Major Facilitator Superfamily protein [Streptomyces sp. 2112.2]SOE09306.1 Major Facilitator Superfamily protein [Streptomyces sp. 2323.1]
MDDSQRVGSWRELGRYFGTAVVLAGGVLVGAVNIYMAASLLPTAVAEIGGERLYAWNMTVFLIAQVVSTMLVSRTLSRHGDIGSYLVGFGVFAVGSVVCAASPTMPVLLVGRGAQGLGAGLLTGLGFALIYSALPARLWVRGSALISAMFGLGNFVGPTLGGLFAQFGAWRPAFVVLAVVSGVMAAFVPRVLPTSRRTSAEAVQVPLGSLLLVIGATAAVSVAGILSNEAMRAVLIALALALVMAFAVTEKGSQVRVLPRPTYQTGSALRWVYLTIAFLAAGVAVETFLPLFGQRLGALPPVAAGFFGAALSLGWSASQVVSSSARRQRTVRRLRVAGPGLLTAGLAILALLQHRHASLPLVLAWLPLLLLAGTGIGLAMPHLSVAAMASTPDKKEGEKAAAAIATVLTMSTAFGAAVAGLLVNLGGPSLVTSARYLLLGFAAVSALGMLTALRANQLAQLPADTAHSSTTAASR